MFHSELRHIEALARASPSSSPSDGDAATLRDFECCLGHFVRVVADECGTMTTYGREEIKGLPPRERPAPRV